MEIVHNPHLKPLIRPQYTAAELSALLDALVEHGSLTFRSLPNGLYPAAEADEASGYQYVWVRDNVYIAHAHFVCGDIPAAARTASTLLEYFQKHRARFLYAIENGRPADPMHRPHIRFDGKTLEELSQKWSHAQNDALGYFLWLYCKLARQGMVKLDASVMDCLALFPLYFEAIEYWDDPDSGHWEEERKVSASSVGAVVAGLREFQCLADEMSLWPVSAAGNEAAIPSRDRILALRDKGQTALNAILPCESIQPASSYRRYDAALIFLIYPLDVLTPDQADEVLQDVKIHLEGENGIRRYLGDSYWCPDYKEVFPAELRTDDSSDAMKFRNALAQVGKEAQWCIFDSIISIIHGQRLHSMTRAGSGETAANALPLQTHYLNRALGQITGEEIPASAWRAPESYYLQRGQYVPNDQVPLYWAQANLWAALHQMRKNLSDEKRPLEMW